MTGAAFFDLDKTLLSTSATLAFGHQFLRAGVVSPGDAVKAAWQGAVYHRFGASTAAIERARDDLAVLIRDLRVGVLVGVVDAWLDTVIPPLVYPTGRELIAQHRAAGRPVVIASSSGTELVSPIATLLGVDHVVATVSEIKDGRFTGDVPFFAFAEAKAQAVRDLAREQGWDLAESYAYSDSYTDIPMLETVGHPYAVNPDRTLRREARERGWPILTFELERRHSPVVPDRLRGPGRMTSRTVDGFRSGARRLGRRIDTRERSARRAGRSR